MKYHKIKDYDATIIREGETLALACCDCGLVHHVKLVATGNVTIAFKSDKRATAQLRRYNYGDLQQAKNKMYELNKVSSNSTLITE